MNKITLTKKLEQTLRLLLFGVLLLASTGSIFAETAIYVDNVGYFLNSENNTCDIYRWSKSAEGEVIIPSSIEYNGQTYSVCEISYKAFTDCDKVTKVIIPNSVKSISSWAFYGCKNIKNIEIANSVTFIGQGAFLDCISLEEIILPNSISIVNSELFKGCSMLRTVVIPHSIETIDKDVFSGCTSLKELSIPNSVINIKKNAFQNSNVETLIIENGEKELSWITSSPKEEFDNVPLINLYLGRSLHYIPYHWDYGSSPFYHNKTLQTVIIGDSVPTINVLQFCGCTALKKAVIANSVTAIGQEAFSGCSELQDVSIGSSVKSIGRSCFSGCENLKTISLPNSVDFLGEHAFSKCSNLKEILLPNSLNKIEYGTFSNCSQLQSINIPNSVNYIGEYSFSKCKSLRNVKIPESVAEIADYAFDNCSELLSIVFGDSSGNGNMIINRKALNKCEKLEEIILGGSVKSIGGDSFVYPNTNLKKVVSYSLVPPDIEYYNNYTYVGIPSDLLLYVKPEVVLRYSNSKGWREFTVRSMQLVTSINLNTNRWEGNVGVTFKINANISPESVTNNIILWSSSDPCVATVNEEGVVTAVSVGEAMITATATDGSGVSAECKVTVNPVLAESISVEPQIWEGKIGETIVLNAVVLPDNTSNKSVKWISQNPEIAEVDEDGTVKGVSEGETIITATTVDGTELTANCCVNIKPVLASAVIFEKETLELIIGDQFTLVAAIEPGNTTDKSIEWSSSDEAVATVSGEGVVTAISVGKAIITARCGEVTATCEVTVLPVTASAITLDKEELELIIGDEYTLSASIDPENTTDKTIEWSSSDESVATVSSDGVVTAISVGKANITARCGEVTATCEVTVLPVVASAITLDKEELELIIGDEYTMSASIDPENTTDKTIEWSSSDESVVMVSGEGVVTAISVGKSIITAKCGEVSATCEVTVLPVLASAIIIDQEVLDLIIGDEFTLTATIEPENTTDKTIEWSSSDESVATVSSEGVVTAISVGKATITARCGEVTATCEVTVNPVLASSITLDKEALDLIIGDEFTLAATIEPENTTDKTIEWNSSDESVVMVSGEGIVTAISVGKATITARCGEVSATCEVTVLPVMASAITLDKEELELIIGDEFTLTASVDPENTTDKTVVWSSDNETVAIVDQNGKVTALKVGSAIIMAKCGDASATCIVTVNPILATSVILDREKAELELNMTLQLNAVVEPAETTDKTIVWSSSDGNVATVSDNGLVTPVAEGIAIILATCGEVKAECEITVVASSGITEIFGGNDTKVEVYTLQGLKLNIDKAADLKNLTTGFYIINGKKIYVK